MTEELEGASFEPIEADTAGDSAGPPLAGRGTRLGAAILDTLIGLVISCPVMMFTGYIDRAMQQQVSPVEMAIYTMGGMVVYLLIHGYLLATQGQSVGKKLLGIRIVDYESNEILPFGKLVGLRLLPVWIVSAIPFANCLALVDVLFIFGEERRCVHDLIAGSKVVQV